MSPPILAARGLKRHFVTKKPIFGAPTVVRAVDGVDLEIRRGETFAIVGESGCGKSTLARLLVGLIPPSEGDVAYEGRGLAGMDAEALRGLRREMQFVFQDPFSSLNPRMTVGALIEEPMRAHGIGDAETRRARVADLMRRVGLRPQQAGRYPHEFSGGQRQRIGIARALATGPSLIVGDEPVSALDVSIQAQVINILEDLKDEFGLTLVIIAHDLAVIRHMADRVAVMYLGEIVEVAPAAMAFETPRHPYTEALLSAIPLPVVGARRAKTHIEGDLPSPVAPPPGCRFHTRCPYSTEICRTERPVLVPVGEGREVACHHAETLTLTGIDTTDTRRSPAATERFRLYQEARERASGTR